MDLRLGGRRAPLRAETARREAAVLKGGPCPSYRPEAEIQGSHARLEDREPTLGGGSSTDRQNERRPERRGPGQQGSRWDLRSGALHVPQAILPPGFQPEADMRVGGRGDEEGRSGRPDPQQRAEPARGSRRAPSPLRTRTRAEARGSRGGEGVAPPAVSRRGNRWNPARVRGERRRAKRLEMEESNGQAVRVVKDGLAHRPITIGFQGGPRARGALPPQVAWDRYPRPICIR